MQIVAVNYDESTTDAEEKQTRSHELDFAENQKFINIKFRAHLL